MAVLRSFWLLFVALARTTTASPAPPRVHADSCTRATLQAGADALVAALQAGDVALLKPVTTADVTYSENRQPAAPLGSGSGILTQPLTPDHVRSSLDTTQCATYTEVIVANQQPPHVLGFQMFWSQGPSAAIHRIDSVVTSTGDWLFNATSTLSWARREDWGPIAGTTDSRTVIQAAADAYCDIFSNKSVVVPWGTPCARLEGGSYTGRGAPSDSCNVGIPSGVSLHDRRYVIDETVGAVDVFMAFASLPDSHEFRVEHGKLRFVHTLTVMGGSRGGGRGGGQGGGRPGGRPT